ncbi:MAG: hypothetical protein AAGA85_11075 [Bacteroidota bacterium]
MMRRKRQVGLAGLFLLFMLLLNVPFISIPDGTVAGMPRLMLYLGIVWLVLIVLMGIIYNQKERS